MTDCYKTISFNVLNQSTLADLGIIIDEDYMRKNRVRFWLVYIRVFFGIINFK